MSSSDRGSQMERLEAVAEGTGYPSAERLSADETDQVGEGHDCQNNFHTLPNKLSTECEWAASASLTAPLMSSAVSARHKAGAASEGPQPRLRARIKNQWPALSGLLFMSSLFAQMFAANHALEPWRQEHRSNQLTWSAQANDDFRTGSQLIPSARYVYTYPSRARKRFSAPTSANNGERIRQLHDQLNQLKRELDHELGRGPQGQEAAESTAASIDERRPNAPPSASQIELGSACLSTNFCQKSIRNSHCNLENFTCECLGEHVKLNSTTCLAPALLGFDCQLDDQCRLRVPESVCRAGKCSCPGDQFLAYKRNKCLKASKLNDYCLLDGQCQLNDRHSFCRWKIQNIYGTCKCPPNYSLVSDAGNKLRCAPRLGDSCLDDLECQLVTKNSVCRESGALPIVRKWTSSQASNKSCTCDTNFGWSSDMLKCSPVGANGPVPNITSAQTVSIDEQPEVEAVRRTQQDSHKYELLDVTGGTATTTGAKTSAREQSDSGTAAAAAAATAPGAELEIKLVPLVDSDEKLAQSTTTTTTTTTTATTSTERPALNESLIPHHQEDAPRTFRTVSLGKACQWRQECQARDPNSDCIGGICECLAPSSSCRAAATGCHPSTFQCRSGQCISWYFVCDQFRNCDDGSDEDDCRPGHCPPEAFQCRADGQCLTRGRVCDGQRDCSDGSDEFACGRLAIDGGAKANRTGTTNDDSLAPAGCPGEAFACANGQCLPGFVFCNAVEDCADGSDEDELICERTSELTLAATNRHNSSSAGLAGPQAQVAPAQRRNETSEAESPLVKTDRASIERLMASLGLVGGVKWRPKASSAGVGGGDASAKSSRRSRLMKSRKLEERRRLGPDQPARRQFLVKNQRLGHGMAASRPGECPATAFTCRNGKCRSSAILCSGVDGCGDNSDESHCEVCQCEAPTQQPAAASSRTTNSRRRNGWAT